MDTKHIHCMLEKIAEYGKCMMEAGVGEGNVNLDDASKVVDMVKDLAEAEYHALIAREMRHAHEEEEAEEKYMMKRFKEEYGEEEGEKRFYDDYRYKRSGRFAPKRKGSYMPRRGYDEPPYWHMMPDMYEDYNAEEMRDLDRHKGRMYYTPMASDMGKVERKDGMRPETRYDKAKRGYEEAKETHKGGTPEDKQITMREAEKFVNVATDEIMEMLEDASPEVKNMVKTKVMSKIQKLQ